MKIASFPVRTERERKRLIVALSARQLPFMCSVKQGVPRSYEQNKLQRKWMNEAAEQGDQTAEEYRAFCKLTIGVPILKAEDDVFAAAYDEHIKPLPYEQKLALMAEPIDTPVTRRMSSKAKAAYLDAVYQYFTAQCGYVLTDPGEPGVMRADR